MSKLIAGVLLVASLMAYQSYGAETLTVKQAVISAFAVHPSMTVARGGYHQALGQRLVDISPDPASVSIEYEGISGGKSINAHREKTLNFSQEFEFPPKYVWRAKAARITVHEARINALIQLLDLEQEVRNAYVQTWMIGEKYNILQEDTEAANNYALQIKRMVELGESAPLEQRRAAVEALQATAQRDAMKNEVAAVWGSFQGITGIDITEKKLIPPSTIYKLQNFNFEDSYELKEAALQSKLSNLEKNTAVFGWLPNLEATYFIQNVPGEADPDFWGVKFGISVPIWFWLGGRGEVQVSKAKIRAAEGNIEEIRLRQRIETDALTQTQAALSERLVLYESQIHPLAKEVHDMATKSYELGEATYLDVIDAQRTLLDIRLEHLEIKAELANMTSELYRLTGRSIIGHEELLKLLDKGN